MASILKVFLMRTKECKGYSAEQRGQKGWEKRKGLGSGSRQARECNLLGEARLVLYAWWQYAILSSLRYAEQKKVLCL